MKFIKKILVSIIALVMSVCVFGFTACDQGNDGSDINDNNQYVTDGTDGKNDGDEVNGADGTDEKNDGNEGNGAGDNDGNDEDGEDDDLKTILTEDTDFEALVSEKVTQEEWENIFADNSKYSNCTLKNVYEQFDSMTETQITDIYYAKYQAVDNELYILQSDNHSDVVTYIHCIDGSVYGYAPGQTTDWSVMLDPNEEVSFEGGYEPFCNWMTTYRSWCPDFSDFFDRFTYNEELGQYEFLGGENDYISTNTVGYYGGYLANYRKATVKIINGRLAYVTFNDQICYFYDFNNSAFDIPQI